MRIIQPLTITDAMLTSATIPENDYPVHSMATAYSVGDRVIVTTGVHKVYECLVAHTGFDPVTDTTGKWLTVGATNRWKAFDGVIGDQATFTDQFDYNLIPGSPQPVVALFGLEAASVQVRITDAFDVLQYVENQSLVNNAAAVDWWNYFFSPVSYDTEAVFYDLPIYSDSKARVRVSGSGTVKVGQIVLGTVYVLGKVDADPRVGIVDYSRKEVDAFGRASIVKRPYSQTVDFDFHFPGPNTRQVLRTLANLRSTACVFWAGPDTIQYGTTVYGYYKDFALTVQGPTVTYATLQVEGLV